MKIKRFIDCIIPVTTCNFRCHYCYITHKRLFSSKLPVWKYSPEQMGRALSVERLGGVCLLNFCGGGETLLPPEMPEIIRQVLLQGHYLMVVTNGTVSPRFDEICTFPPELLERLFFKFSFHYEQLISRNKLDVYFDNVRKVREAGCSYTIELTPFDEIIPDIEHIKELCKERAGALCHVTVTRNEKDAAFPLLTHLSREEFRKVWGSFDSPLFDFKESVFSRQRPEFCYAGDWSSFLDFGSGVLRQCYRGRVLVKDLFADMRERVCADGSHWLTPAMKEFFSSKLVESNREYSPWKKMRVEASMVCRHWVRKGLSLVKR